MGAVGVLYSNYGSMMPALMGCEVTSLLVPVMGDGGRAVMNTFLK